MRLLAGWLLGQVAEQLTDVVDHAIAIAVKAKPAVSRVARRPGDQIAFTVEVHVEPHSVLEAGQVEPGAVQVDDDGRRIDGAGVGITSCASVRAVGAAA